jgi:hypothetical protein
MRIRARVGLIIVCTLLLAGLLACYRYMRMHSFSAREKPNRLEVLLARKARRLAVPPGITELKNPIAVCHGNKGDGRTMINAGLYPPAPDLRLSDTQDLSDGEILFIIKNGIRFTGMPGWGGSDEENWKLVLFIRHLPKLSDKERALMNEVNHIDSGK